MFLIAPSFLTSTSGATATAVAFRCRLSESPPCHLVKVSPPSDVVIPFSRVHIIQLFNAITANKGRKNLLVPSPREKLR